MAATTVSELTVEEFKQLIREVVRQTFVEMFANLAEKSSTAWPPHIVALAGAWADMPLAEELRQDAPREQC